MNRHTPKMKSRPKQLAAKQPPAMAPLRAPFSSFPELQKPIMAPMITAITIIQNHIIIIGAPIPTRGLLLVGF